ncbi:hypothetical protein KDM41_14210 [bacterium]|nr:hypothetical protein [bacterium]
MTRPGRRDAAVPVAGIGDALVGAPRPGRRRGPQRHAVFGRMSAAEAGLAMARHLAHHRTRFGV